MIGFLLCNPIGVNYFNNFNNDKGNDNDKK